MEEITLYRIIHDYMTKHKLSGFYRAVVENDCDPLSMGRVQVRAFIIHGLDKETGIPTEELPWCQVIYFGSSGWDFGSYDPPIIGTTVLVMFEMGMSGAPIVVGNYQGIPATDDPAQNVSVQDVTQYGESKNAETTPGVPRKPTAMGKWFGKNRLETPKEAHLTINNEPTTRVLFKTPKGSSLAVNEGGETEGVSFVDRAGQGIAIKGRVLADKSQGNAEQRGTRKTASGTQMIYGESMQDADTSIRIQDMTSQGIRIKGKRGEERVRIQSKKPSFDFDECAKKEIRVFDVGEERQTFELNAGHGIAVLEGLQGGDVKLRVRYDANRPIIEIDAHGEGSTVVINGQRFTVGANTIVLEGDIQLDGDVMIAGDLTVTGEIIEGRYIEEGSKNYR